MGATFYAEILQRSLSDRFRMTTVEFGEYVLAKSQDLIRRGTKAAAGLPRSKAPASESGRYNEEERQRDSRRRREWKKRKTRLYAKRIVGS
jgi:hypothetical protein